MVAATAAMGMSVPQLLANVTPDQICTSPYPHFSMQNVLPRDVYSALDREFPDLATVLNGRTSYGNNEAVRMSAKQVLADQRISPLWRSFFEYHTSAEYWRNVIRLFGDFFRQEFPGLETRLGRRFEDWRVIPRGFSGEAEVRLDCQFVMNTPVTQVSSVKSPHVDLCDKIFSGLFYFRDPNDTTAGGDLQMYAWQRSPRFIKHRTMNRDIKLAKTIHYAPNTYLCFVNSVKAIHGVSPRGITAIPRRYINFIAELPVEAFRPQQLNRWQRILYRSELNADTGEERY
ncbi:hypothetical protein ACFPL7_09225 [Dongia soli]|uniref:2OG-Fe(II) oxygenase n=1 Tax=Dongia soli TaxID=600628 RepID=A0ABU5EAQ2_9PROT|nr:hypothetical protein [Dongia soli]MDY0883129.1 hypothetical protein [Dongia soli]